MSVVSWRRMASDLTDQVRELQKERDELLAEVERLRRPFKLYDSSEMTNRIARLTARVQVTEAKLIDTAELYERMKQRAEAAEAEVERLNRIVVSQSQQLGNTRSQREHELIEELAAAEAEVETVAQAVRELCDKWDCDDLDELEDKLTALDELDSYSGHLKWMDKHYPLDVPYFAESEDVGCQVMRLSRKVMEVEAERDRLRWMLIRNVCDECLVHTSGACSEEEGEDCPPVRDALADLAARYDARHEDGDG